MNYILTALVGLATFLGATFAIPTPTIWDEPSINLGATSFATSLDVLSNPSSTDSVSTVSHSGQHSNANDALEALQAKLGIGASTATNGTILIGNGVGSSAWSSAPSVTTFTASGLGTFGGFISTASSTVLGNLNITGNSTSTNATSTNFFTTTASSTNLNYTTANGGNLTSTGLIKGTNLWSTGSSTLTNFTFANATGTSATTTNLFATNASTTNLKVVTGTINNLTVDSCTGCATQTNVATLVPRSAFFPNTATTSRVMSVNTTMFVGQVVLTAPITVNKVTIRSGDAITTAGVLDITMYSEDGQTQYFSVTTASVAGAGTFYTTAVSAVTLPVGNYYLAVNTNSTTNVEMTTMNTQVNVSNAYSGWSSGVATEPVLEGTVTITAGTPPATIAPASITATGNSHTLMFRIDN